MNLCNERLSKAIRIFFLVLSILGWIVVLGGFGRLLKSLHDYKPKDDDFFKPIKGSPQAITGVMWLFVVSALFLYITSFLHILKRTDNMGHVLHCLIVFFNLFYIFGAVLLITIGLLYHTKAKGLLVPILHEGSERPVLVMLIGCFISVIASWTGMCVWPLFNIRRPRYMGYTELQESQAIN